MTSTPNPNEKPVSRALHRSIGAVLAGLLALVALSIVTDIVLYAASIFPSEGRPASDAVWLLPSAYRFVYGVAGCYLAAWCAPNRPMLHAWILGAIGVALGLIGVVVNWDKGPELGPLWYSIVVFALPIPCAWLGGTLYLRTTTKNAG